MRLRLVSAIPPPQAFTTAPQRVEKLYPKLSGGQTLFNFVLESARHPGVVSPDGGGGGGGGGAGEVTLLTLMVTAELSLVLSAASRALAARVWEPLAAEVVFQETE